MPLPTNTSLSLLGHSRPGDTVHSKPKQAMIVRMSAETLEALEAFPQHPQMDFEFSDNPGIYIGDTFFPMRPLKESSPHELYLRASSAAKPMAPLKLHAAVTGKFMVGRELGAKVENQVRESTIGAAKQRSARTTIMIDTPPEISSANSRKRKEPPASMFRKPVRQPEPSRSNAVASSSSLPVPAPLPAPVRSPSHQPNKEGLANVRSRLVRCLAIMERTSEEAVKLVGGPNCDSTLRRDILELLTELAEPSSTGKTGTDKSPKTWRLKPKSWLEVRPYEWPGLAESDKTTMARAARLAYKNLGIPESDAAWSHVRYRSPTNGTVGASSSAGPSRSTAATGSTVGTSKAGPQPGGGPKRGVSSKEAKEKKAKPKVDPKAEIQMKDESIKSAPRVSSTSGKARELNDPSLRAASLASSSRGTPPVRKPPGSGFRVGKSTSQDSRPDSAQNSGGNSPLRKPVDDRAKDREFASTSLPAKPSTVVSNQDKQAGERKPVNAVSSHKAKKPKAVDAVAVDTTKEKRERQTDKDKVERIRSKERDPGIEKDKARESRDPVATKDAPTLKRKKPLRDGEDHDQDSRMSSMKKRKTEDSEVPAKADQGPPRRPKVTHEQSSVAPTQIKAKGDPQPPHKSYPSPTKISSSSTSSSSSQVPSQIPSNTTKATKTNAINKVRRRSPIYTSSEDEGEIRRQARRDAPLASSAVAPTTQGHTHAYSHSRARSSRPLPTDHASLRARYSSSYLDYLATFHKLVVQKGKIDSLLKENGSAGSITESDGDIELMTPEELVILRSEHRTLQEELEAIQQLFSRSDR